MAGMSAEEFERQVISICSASSAVRNMAVINLGLTWFNMRAYLIDESFVEIFYNQATGKTAFAQIRDEHRVFGADNKQGWHWHPYKDPHEHLSAVNEISFEEFLQQVEDNINKE